MSGRATGAEPETAERPAPPRTRDAVVFRGTVRAAAGFLCLGAWLGLLLFGWTAGGAVHALLLLGAAIFPWRWLSPGTRGDDPHSSGLS